MFGWWAGSERCSGSILGGGYHCLVQLRFECFIQHEKGNNDPLQRRNEKYHLHLL